MRTFSLLVLQDLIFGFILLLEFGRLIGGKVGSVKNFARRQKDKTENQRAENIVLPASSLVSPVDDSSNGLHGFLHQTRLDALGLDRVIEILYAIEDSAVSHLQDPSSSRSSFRIMRDHNDRLAILLIQLLQHSQDHLGIF